MRKIKCMDPHPLEDIVWRAFAKRNGHDSTSLAFFMAGSLVLGAHKAYCKVALDVLEQAAVA